ncbi:MAG: ribosome maturation factor RimP [Rhodospirillaceae bacterium]|nr:ribosome maturation factor RimP [Rhodospirillaceae bacterium]MDD9999743.1 ribosome maturation factor RimP [Rhodospirillaceae bacterium]MDE0361360.1 ribosome maturation factor RimP [Rhodospirillaceae bacterium]
MDHAIRKQRLLELLEPPLDALGYELVDLDVRVGRRGLLRVFIDKENGVNLADCEFVSGQLSAFLDVEDPLPGRYVLEVSSPGLDRPLRTLEHFRRFRDRPAKVRLREPRENRRMLNGRLLGIRDESIVMDVDGEIWRLQPAEIASARLVSSL